MRVLIFCQNRCNMNIAILKDIQKDYISAVHCYETELIVSDKPDIDIFINLAFIYWEFAAEEIEFNKPNGIPEEWARIGVTRFQEVLQLALTQYPLDVELNFWVRYLKARLFLEEFTHMDCLALMEKFVGNSLVPYFYLSLTGTETYSRELSQLLEHCNKHPTAKNNYIKTFL